MSSMKQPMVFAVWVIYGKCIVGITKKMCAKYQEYLDQYTFVVSDITIRHIPSNSL